MFETRPRIVTLDDLDSLCGDDPRTNIPITLKPVLKVIEENILEEEVITPKIVPEIETKQAYSRPQVLDDDIPWL